MSKYNFLARQNFLKALAIFGNNDLAKLKATIYYTYYSMYYTLAFMIDYKSTEDTDRPLREVLLTDEISKAISPSDVLMLAIVEKTFNEYMTGDIEYCGVVKVISMLVVAINFIGRALNCTTCIDDIGDKVSIAYVCRLSESVDYIQPYYFSV